VNLLMNLRTLNRKAGDLFPVLVFHLSIELAQPISRYRIQNGLDCLAVLRGVVQ